jgi:hypothetical protein
MLNDEQACSNYINRRDVCFIEQNKNRNDEEKEGEEQEENDSKKE